MDEKKIELKKFDFENPELLKKEWDYIRTLPPDENGFTNTDFGISWEDFLNVYVPSKIKLSEGKDLPEGWVPQTNYLLWIDGEIAGMFRVRPILNDFLRNVTGGHIGYGLRPEFRGKGYATIGLSLALKELKKLTADSEALLFCHKDNPASLRVMQKNGGVVYGETDENFCTKIDLSSF
ncbi:GNAT family N-acetyltransferase [Treponema zioleckii]|uniref:GNAT family N-acetyltransferase n=1 Tax=Treponema zioleckii TaxID=331680 RepID=UPI00168BB299|nr:GNAT family N-acetyltransferase [Treponema zioleckii]